MNWRRRKKRRNKTATQHGVCIPDTGSKIFQRAHGAALEPHRMRYNVYPLVVRVVIPIIIGMVLHGDRVQENGLIRGSAHLFVLLNDLVGHGVIGHKAAGPVVLAQKRIPIVTVVVYNFFVRGYEPAGLNRARNNKVLHSRS